ncbi:hypothetical protein BCR44DRAFT_1441575 [Catenaria anguillulae PL171]|uniref:Uncharacterized protein n=1 Tax=Catenaria anguillulae PL171 TaxID=765915 RepID=A0A1Y2HB05_9FUNG|nr:hypothetical protein BCR44DRAFT_1441575 [Catenaria anguillulae PL171]
MQTAPSHNRPVSHIRRALPNSARPTSSMPAPTPPQSQLSLVIVIITTFLIFAAMSAIPANAQGERAKLVRRQAQQSRGRLTATIRLPPRSPIRSTTTTTRTPVPTQTRVGPPTPSSSIRQTRSIGPDTTSPSPTATSFPPSSPILPTEAPAPDGGKIDEASSPPAWSDRIEIVPAGPDAAARPIAINAAGRDGKASCGRGSQLVAGLIFVAGFVGAAVF